MTFPDISSTFSCWMILTIWNTIYTFHWSHLPHLGVQSFSIDIYYHISSLMLGSHQQSILLTGFFLLEISNFSNMHVFYSFIFILFMNLSKTRKKDETANTYRAFLFLWSFEINLFSHFSLILILHNSQFNISSAKICD